MALKQRARRDEDKRERRASILRAAKALFDRSPRLDTTIAEVAQRAGLAKGTVFLYFATREALQLAALELELDAWFDALDAALDEPGRWTIARVAALLTRSIAERPLLSRLLPRLENELAHNAPAAALRPALEKLSRRTSATAQRIERRLPFLTRVTALRLLLQTRALSAGLTQIASTSAVSDALLDEAPLSALRVDAARELETALTALLRGLEAAAADRV